MDDTMRVCIMGTGKPFKGLDQTDRVAVHYLDIARGKFYTTYMSVEEQNKMLDTSVLYPHLALVHLGIAGNSVIWEDVVADEGSLTVNE